MKKSLSLLLLTGLVSGGWLLAAQLNSRMSGRDPGYVVHEWGTFTDVQGSDGVQMIWNPAIAPDLPKFVYSYTGQLNSKAGIMTLQRMETPVIYFYSDRERTVDVSVNFPQGLITEWFPGKDAADRSFRYPTLPTKIPSLHWNKVRLLPSVAPSEGALPRDERPTNYYPARETDASILQVESGGKTETEKFLFYRGVARFEAPLTVKMEALPSTRVIVKNTGAEPLKHLYLHQVTEKGATWIPVAALAAGESRTVALPEPGRAASAELASALRTALVDEGLYEKEAAAMVKTWQAAWLEERGIRVLYTLPRAWTDRTLPLQLAPATRQIERVMVGRAEIISPAMEQAVGGLLDRYTAAPSAESKNAVLAEIRGLALGRFLQPTLSRALKTESTPEFLQSYSEVLRRLQPPPAPAPVAPVVAATAKR